MHPAAPGTPALHPTLLQVVSHTFALSALAVFCLANTATVTTFLALHPELGMLPAPASERIVVDFGVDVGGEFVSSDVVPLVPGQTFGWRLSAPPGSVVDWREELDLPAAPRVWELNDSTTLLDPRHAVSSGIASLGGDTTLEHGWVVTDGDPAGTYHMRIFANDVLVRRVVFVLRPVL